MAQPWEWWMLRQGAGSDALRPQDPLGPSEPPGDPLGPLPQWVIDAQREPDLGWVGNSIRAQLDYPGETGLVHPVLAG